MMGLTANSDGHERLARRRRYRWGYFGSIAAGVIALVIASRLGYPLVGIGLYWVGVVAMLAILWASPVTLFDEREQRVEARAASLTLNLMAIVGAAAIPGAVVLERAGYVTITPTMEGIALGYLAFYVVGLVVYALLWLRQ